MWKSLISGIAAFTVNKFTDNKKITIPVTIASAFVLQDALNKKRKRKQKPEFGITIGASVGSALSLFSLGKGTGGIGNQEKNTVAAPPRTSPVSPDKALFFLHGDKIFFAVPGSPTLKEIIINDIAQFIGALPEATRTSGIVVIEDDTTTGKNQFLAAFLKKNNIAFTSKEFFSNGHEPSITKKHAELKAFIESMGFSIDDSVFASPLSQVAVVDAVPQLGRPLVNTRPIQSPVPDSPVFPAGDTRRETALSLPANANPENFI